jgi:polyisoprenoid-binding protein YceI
LALSILGTCGVVAAAPQAYVLDPAHSFVHFEVLHFATSTLPGRFGPIEGTVQWDREARRGYVGIEIDMSRVDTGIPVLDRRLQRPDLLATEAHPRAWFVAERFVYDGDRLAEVRGELTLRGRSAPLTLRAERFGCRRDAEPAREVCGGDFVAELTRSAFGIDFGLPFVADRVLLRVQVEAWRR